MRAMARAKKRKNDHSSCVAGGDPAYRRSMRQATAANGS
jgi:hypothetical protein